MVLRYDSRSRVSTYTQSWVSNADPDFGAYESIGTITLSSATTVVSFVSLPQTYKHLQVRLLTKANLATNYFSAVMRLNSDSGSNYSYHQMSGNGASTSSSGSYPQASVFFNTAGSNNASVFCANVIDILDYTNTNKYKTVRVFGGLDTNGAGTVGMSSSVWSNTAAVTGLLFSSDGYGDWLQYSLFALYGIKG
jgi:hypothetical protein